MDNKSKNQCCSLCKSAEEDELNLGRKLEYENKTFHHFCLLFAPGLPQNGKDDEGIEGFLMKDILKEIKRVQRLKCTYCGLKGANLGCCDLTCPKAYHTTCALRKNVRFEFTSKFETFCYQHKKIRQRYKETKLDPTCGICYDALQKSFPKSILIPCCKNSWFHKSCLQKFAVTAGSLFKCPLCSNKECKKELELMGVFFPETDGFYECEQDAYQEFCQPPRDLVCENLYCKDKTKDADQPHLWKMCENCGSRGIHYDYCLRLGPGERFECWTCKEMLNKTGKPIKPKSFTSWLLIESDVSDEE